MSLLWAAAALGALLELDGDSFGQFGFARPIVVGPLLGCLLGAPATGLMFGIVLELLALGELPVGGHIPLNATIATAAALMVALGGRGPDGSAYALLSAVPFGVAFGALRGALERPLRALRGRLAAREGGIGGALVASLGAQAALNFILLAAALLLRPGQGGLPDERILVGLQRLLWVTPWLGAATLLHSLRARA